MIYRIQNGGSWFHNGHGQEFRTVRGSVVVGSQASVYKAMAADGLAWGFQVLCVPCQHLMQSAHQIRARGFQVIDPNAPLQRVLSAFLEQYFQEFDTLDAAQSVACLRALDLLLVACMAGDNGTGATLACTLAQERHRKALQYVENNLLHPGLCSARVARHLCISERQLHRSFEAHGTSVSAEVRRLRLAYALEQLTHSPGMPVTQIAYQCGFDSLSTFYRAVKKAYGHTATELRAQAAP
jgi:AraC-like DNA-binding protein